MNNSPLEKQNELIRSLRKQLQATERALDDQKWLFQQFLQSPSWRLTLPIRWLAKKLRSVRAWLVGTSAPAGVIDNPTPEIASVETTEMADEESSTGLKDLFADFYRIQFQAFLSSNTALQLPGSDSPEISILLVLFNRAELTFACLRSLTENYSQRIEVIIVDNNSQDETSLLLNRLRGARVIRNGENRNFLLAANQAAEAARGNYLLLLNNDAQLLPGTLQSALNTIRSATDIGAVGGRLILLDGTLQEAGSIIWRDGSCLGYGRGDNPFAPMYMFRRDVDYCSGAFLLTPRRTWQDLGGFDESFQPAYYEETDYCTRLWRRNLRVVYDPTSVLLHYEFASSASAERATALQREHQNIFAARHRDLLASHFQPDPNSILPARMKHRTKRRILFIDDRVPHVWLGSGFPRSRAILLAFLKDESFVTVYPLSEFNEDWASVYSDMPPEIEFMMGFGPELLETFLRNRTHYYDSIFISRPHNMKILQKVLDAHPEWFNTTRIIYDAEAIFVSREITYRRMVGNPLTPQEENERLKQEAGLALGADCVVTVSGPDAENFRKQGIQNVRVIGHALAPAPTPRPFEERKDFLFVGAIHEEASPNGDSVIWFIEEILPRVQAKLGSHVGVTIAGINKSERVKRLECESVRVTGHLPDLTDLYNDSRVFVAPTRYAAGIPHKVHEAAAKGLPVVATPLLATQLGWPDGDPILVGIDAEDFAKKCVELYRNSALWKRLREAGIERIRKECSTAMFEASLRECISPAAAAVPGVHVDVGMDR